MPPASTASAASRGFTLMELMVVIIVVTILTAMIVPELRGSFEETLLRSSASRLAGACNVAYSRAVAAGQPQRLRFDPSTGKYRVEADENPSRAPAAKAGAFTDIPDAFGTIDPRITVILRHGDAPVARQGNARDVEPARGEGISFHADGTADAAEFQLRDRSGFRLVVSVNPITSRVRVANHSRQ